MKTLSSISDALADKCVAGDLAALADASILLNFNECADLCIVSDFAPIEIDELRQPHVLPQLDVSSDCN